MGEPGAIREVEPPKRRRSTEPIHARGGRLGGVVVLQQSQSVFPTATVPAATRQLEQPEWRRSVDHARDHAHRSRRERGGGARQSAFPAPADAMATGEAKQQPTWRRGVDRAHSHAHGDLPEGVGVAYERGPSSSALAEPVAANEAEPSDMIDMADPGHAPSGWGEGEGGVRTEGLLKSRKAVLPSEIRRRERSVDDPQRARHHRSRRPGPDDDPLCAPDEDPAPARDDEPPVRLRRAQATPLARSGEEGGGGERSPGRHKIRTRSMSDIGVVQRSAVFRSLERAASRERLHSPGREPPGLANGDIGLDTRVSVAQLRHSYLETANRKPEL